MICKKCDWGGTTQYYPHGGGTAPFHPECYALLKMGKAVRKEHLVPHSDYEIYASVDIFPIQEPGSLVSQCLCRSGAENPSCPFFYIQQDPVEGSVLS